ncbi:hypothetical protein BOTBODRAFT_36967 [Botryobasidium botryosum FD-172 SS1]|uniref:U3 small nucleolar RNA-associated protein 25 n=1 Tax=Botryobasidium botryosum (strain FD-172 SS1) TaxID=930990 RepID=A0A067MD91_BOTB1|nr:hypothetical protein BOTBODRAFT_36967 [Botryobasidium botryosum FD-172 SS1]
MLTKDEDNSTVTKLLTLLNVSAVKSNKRRRFSKPESGAVDGTGAAAEEPKRVKLNKKRVVTLPSEDKQENGESERVKDVDVQMKDDVPQGEDEEDVDSGDESTPGGAVDPHARHFGVDPVGLSASTREAAQQGSWKKSGTSSLDGLGSVLEYVPDVDGTSQGEKYKEEDVLLPKIHDALKSRRSSLSPGIRTIQSTLLQCLSTSRDLYLTRVRLGQHSTIRDITSLYILNHILKIRRTVLKNNARLASSTASANPPDDVQDQGFTRPSVLVLLPFRNSAKAFLEAFCSHFTSSVNQSSTKSQESQIHHYARFVSQYSLPEGAIDKLATAEPGTYPPDHVQTFSGNIDDSFRIGVKVTKKSVRLFEGFYGADMIVASPLGLRMIIEKEKNADFLSSIEIVVVDQMDALAMQNWDHVQFIFSQLNQLPKESHGADFSRIKPWYLDGYASHIRQSIFLTSYEIPETRALFNSLKNVAGKIRTAPRWEGVKVPEGIKQEFVKFDCSNAREEVDKRFDYFTKQFFPAILKSAVQSSSAILFIPSYFDFVRVQNWMRTAEVSFVVISEYSSNQEISRARQAFFAGTKSFLLITERFYFFRRYRLRGVQNIFFYAPPDHAQFYTELLSFPFLDSSVDPTDVTVKVLHSRYDFMKLERIVGSKNVGALIRD